MKILISHTSDQSKWAQVVRGAIDEVKDVVGAGISIEVVDWSTNLIGGVGDEPQSVVNAQIFDCDMLFAVIGNRLGTPTKNHESGTAEEINLFLSTFQQSNTPHSAKIQIYFNEEPVHPSSIDFVQRALVVEYKKKLSAKGVAYKEFQDESYLRKLVRLAVGQSLASSSNSNIIDSHGDDDLEELGLTESLGLANDNIQDAAEIIEALGKFANTLTEKISKISSIPNQEQKLKALADDLPKLFEEASRDLKKNNDQLKIASANSYAYTALALDIAYEDFSFSSSDDDILKLFSSISDATAQLSDLRDGLIETDSAIASIPRINKRLNQAKRLYRTENRNLVDILSDFISNMKSLLSPKID